MEIVWFLDKYWVYMSLIAAATASIIRLIASIIAGVRIGRFVSVIFIISLMIYTFISCFFYTIVLAISVGYTYVYSSSSAEKTYYIWGIGFGVFYVILKMVITGYLNQVLLLLLYIIEINQESANFPFFFFIPK